MADAKTPTHYRVTPKELFIAFDEVFQPGRTYTVKAKVYEALVDGKAFKERCQKAEPLIKSA